MAINTSNMELTFRDEFNSFFSSPGKNYGVWNTGGNTPAYADGRNLIGAGQQVYYGDASTPGHNPFSVSNGVLTIDAVKGGNSAGVPYTSGWIDTSGSFSQQYGYFEMRAQLPEGQGYWPAFWMIRTDRKAGVEIDTLEAVGSEPGRVVNTIHAPQFGWNQYSKGTYVGDTSDSFHTYGVNWTPTKITFYFDGKELYSAPTSVDLRAPMYMIANFGVGANHGWGGAPNGTTPFPGEFNIDYIRAYANEYTTKVEGRAALENASSLNGDITPTTGADIQRGDGNYNVHGTPTKATIELGDGNTKVNLGGWLNTIELGDGNHSVFLKNDGHHLGIGSGNSTINYDGNDITVTLGDTKGTVIKGDGYGLKIQQFGDGKVDLSGTNGATTVELGNGDHVLNLAGASNSISVGDGKTMIVAGTGSGSNRVEAGAGDSTITISGWKNFVDGGEGDDLIQGGKGNSTFVLDWAGHGADTIRNFVLSDQLDLGKALSGTGANTGNLGKFLDVTVSGGNTIISVDRDGNDSTPATKIATLAGVQVSLTKLVSEGVFTFGKYSDQPDGNPTPTPTPAPGTDDGSGDPAITLTGGNSVKASISVKAKALGEPSGGTDVEILKFGGAGGWGKGDNDFINFSGFGKGSKLTFDHTDAGGVHVYDLHSSLTGETYEIAVQSLNGAKLAHGDYNFY